MLGALKCIQRKAITPLLVALCIIAPTVGYHILARVFTNAAGSVVLRAYPEVFVFAEEDAGRMVKRSVRLENVSNHSVRVVGAQANCTCVKPVEDFPFSISGGEQRSVMFEVWVNERLVLNQTLARVFFLFEASETALPTSVVFR